MKAFGPTIDAPVYEEIEWVRTPVELDCQRCGKQIEVSDSGFMLPFLGPDGVTEVPWHRACLLVALGVSD